MGRWDAVIDVSNVCWSAYLPPLGRRTPRWHRLELVMAAWRERHGDDVRFDLVADDSLVRSLDDVREFRRLKASGALVTRPVADSLILERARDRGLHVITRDHYVDHRIEHPWIERSPSRFHCWNTEEGAVRFAPLGIRPCSPQTVSVAREGKDLKRARLDARNPRHRRILETRWKCADEQCVQAAQWQDQLLVWPALNRAGDPVCPSCRTPLVGLGPRDPLFEVVVAERASGTEITRFPLETGQPVVVGRGNALKGVNLALDGAAHRDALKKVSRRHLLLRMDEDRRLAATDLGATNGTEVEYRAQQGFQAPKAVQPGKDVFLGFKDRLVLGGTVTLRLSGRRFSTMAESAHPPGPEIDGSKTLFT
ncbi:FHA domain-containing protein [Spirillospora sp. NPDC048832]